MSLNDDTRKSVLASPLVAAVRKEEFERGWLMAASHVMRAFDEPSIVYDLMAHIGVSSRKKCRDMGLEEFDLKPLYEVLKLEGKR